VARFAHCKPFAKRRKPRKPADAHALARMLVDVYLSDVARAGSGPRAAYTMLVQGMASVFAAPQRAHRREAEHKALAAVTLCVGGMLLARTTEDAALGLRIRRAARREAHALVATRAPAPVVPAKRPRRSTPRAVATVAPR
jgi:TetR/AcrR family transcriptional repressor of nem operon